ncbi:hypothetical protein JDV02_009475 [Purpureocillium takamizusanense]|uniref:BRCT domain-containing protein n=1 Tax=Purpureocillium takamizusanense TaxID=2060973 RepID=A0A9Q8QRZ9_9HYPO|nr:uncharacterized protein JDV02_009475 [Purpureocillium takamizusanense]UNI23669.1 hypothetical protein JDV02_009475 [Purpureocillium takamizusanense]
MESPPKRMTRARAAAKACESTAKTTKIVTAAAKAKTAGTATASTKSTTAKRKTRADEHDDDADHDETVTRRAVRGRPRKGPEANAAADDASAPAPVRAARGRPPKKPSTETSDRDQASTATAVVATAPRPRGRPRKTPAAQSGDAAPAPAAEPAKKTTRVRAPTATKPTVKKTVKFEEPDKENMEPEVAKAREPTTGGMRGRPARRGGATAARTTRAAAATTASDVSQKKPLSPKKVTQMPMSRDDDSSEDELATDKVRTPVRHLTKSPMKPKTTTATVHIKGPEPSGDGPDAEVQGSTVTLNASALGASPPRRPPSSPFKDSLKSPAKRIGTATLHGSALKSTNLGAGHPGQTPSFKSSLLRSAAKRPQSPIKGLTLPPATTVTGHQPQSAIKKTMFQSPAKRALPGFRPPTDTRSQEDAALLDSPKMQPIVMATPTPATRRRPSEKLLDEDECHEELEGDDCEADHAGHANVMFSGRLSAVVPRHADPSLDEEVDNRDDEDEVDQIDFVAEVAEPARPLSRDKDMLWAFEHLTAKRVDDPMALDEIAAGMEDSMELPQRREEEAEGQQTPEGDDERGEAQEPLASDKATSAKYQLRQKDQDPCYDINFESDSEGETTVSIKDHLPTPSRSAKGSRDSRRSTMGLTSLAEQFGSWSAASPIKADQIADVASADVYEDLDGHQETAASVTGEPEPSVKSTFFEDEMAAHVGEAQAVVPPTTANKSLDDGESEELCMDNIMITEEDAALAQEANDLSVLEPDRVEQAVNGGSFDDSVSEASQEYGDENEVPVDPALESNAPAGPVTPMRPPQHRAFFTTTKVPLKPADNSTPSPLKQRSMSASRASSRRPAALPRSATVISYSPTKERRRTSVAAASPSKADMWSSIGTPARTPRRDLDPALLRGAVVFVDVHTTEGADASGIFVELLSQMGARCIKSWHWNPSGESCSSARVGITHVVYKDGGKRTLEKVRESNGIVHCVGVSWVLDCERENRWLDEAPYCIDTSHIPRGGARRRKSMEPKALANLNGTIVGGSSRTSHPPNTPKNRRDSSLWMHSPSDQDGQEDRDHDDDDDDLEWSCVLLTPVPKTPAPEAVARYAAELPETPQGDDSDDEAEEPSPTRQAHLTRTCPPKANPYREMGAGILSRDKDENVLQRLMAARRKSLQFAPKIGSPLSKTWE